MASNIQLLNPKTKILIISVLIFDLILISSLIYLKIIPFPAFNQVEVKKYGQVPKFSLQTQTDKSFTDQDLKNKTTILNFFFTSCPMICPKMNAEVAKLQRELKEIKELQFVSISVDPKRDNSATLSNYANTLGAELSNWFFLTGDEAQILDLSENGFKQGLDPINFTHSTKLILVDKNLEIRGYFDSNSPEELNKLKDLIEDDVLN